MAIVNKKSHTILLYLIFHKGSNLLKSIRIFNTINSKKPSSEDYEFHFLILMHFFDDLIDDFIIISLIYEKELILIIFELR